MATILLQSKVKNEIWDKKSSGCQDNWSLNISIPALKSTESYISHNASGWNLSFPWGSDVNNKQQQQHWLFSMMLTWGVQARLVFTSFYVHSLFRNVLYDVNAARYEVTWQRASECIIKSWNQPDSQRIVGYQGDVEPQPSEWKKSKTQPQMWWHHHSCHVTISFF